MSASKVNIYTSHYPIGIKTNLLARGEGLSKKKLVKKFPVSIYNSCRESIIRLFSIDFTEKLQLIKDQNLKLIDQDFIETTSEETYGASYRFGQPEYNIYTNSFNDINKLNIEKVYSDTSLYIITKRKMRADFDFKSDLEKGLNLVRSLKLDRLTRILDLVVGIPSVLLDRSQCGQEKYINRAGSFRIKVAKSKFKEEVLFYEYTVPSNFLLKNEILLSLVLGLFRLGFQINCDKVEEINKLLNKADKEAVRFAIDNNDLDVAGEIWHSLKNTLIEKSSFDMDSVLNNDVIVASSNISVNIKEHYRFLLPSSNFSFFEFVLREGADKFFLESLEKCWDKKRKRTNGFVHGMKMYFVYNMFDCYSNMKYLNKTEKYFEKWNGMDLIVKESKKE